MTDPVAAAQQRLLDEIVRAFDQRPILAALGISGRDDSPVSDGIADARNRAVDDIAPILDRFWRDVEAAAGTALRRRRLWPRVADYVDGADDEQLLLLEELLDSGGAAL